jgi:hypothetical protein
MAPAPLLPRRPPLSRLEEEDEEEDESPLSPMEEEDEEEDESQLSGEALRRRGQWRGHL